jgi:hypothetical protein
MVYIQNFKEDGSIELTTTDGKVFATLTKEQLDKYDSEKASFWAYKPSAVERHYATSKKYYKATNRWYEDWLDRLALMGTIGKVDWHMECGKLDNIPMCCIKWFVFLVRMGASNKASLTDYLYGEGTPSKDQPLGGYYVKCPKCLKKEREND